MAGRSLTTVAVAVVPPLTVRRKLPLGTPVPVRGTCAGELAVGAGEGEGAGAGAEGGGGEGDGDGAA